MSGLLARLSRAETIEALVMGSLAAGARKRRPALGPSPPAPHRFPDLAGQPIPLIADAALAAMMASHPGDDPNQWPCASCEALLDLASHYADSIDMEWPDPVRRLMAEVLTNGSQGRRPEHDDEVEPVDLIDVAAAPIGRGWPVDSG